MEEKHLLTEDEGYHLLEKYGIPVPDHAVVSDIREAEAEAARIGYPVVLKILSPAIVHKSDAGGVRTGIQSPAELTDAFNTILSNVTRSHPDAPVKGVLVAQHLHPGLELFIGGKTDPAFGKVISCGTGGTTIELFPDFSLRLLPVDRAEIIRMVRELRVYPLIHGFRDRAPRDEEGLIRCIEGVARMFEQESVAEFDINPLILYEEGACAVDARVYQGVAGAPPPDRPEFADGLFHPLSIAVIGASADPKKIGYAVFRNLLPFPGTLSAVNPNQDRILGKAVYHHIADVPGTIDAAVIAVPAAAVPGVMEELGKKGARLAIIISSGFRELGQEGALREQEILRIARENGMRIVGPNCLGVVFPHRRINTTFDPTTPRKGAIGFISQSGAIITTIVDWSVPEEIGFSAIVSVGNQIDLGFIDFLRSVASEPETRAIILYIEEIRDGRAFFNLLREITRTIPVIVLKSGSSMIGKKAATSHTGSLAGDYAVYQAAFLQAGALPVFTIREAFDTAELLVSEGYPAGERAVVITTAGGFAVLASDYAERFGVALPLLSPALLQELDRVLPPLWNRANPLDIIGDGGADRYARVFDTLIRFPDEWDIAIVIAVPSAVLDPAQIALEIARFRNHADKVVVGCLIGGDAMKGGMSVLRHHQIPNYDDIENAFKALGRVLSARRRHGNDTGPEGSTLTLSHRRAGSDATGGDGHAR